MPGNKKYFAFIALHICCLVLFSACSVQPAAAPDSASPPQPVSAPLTDPVKYTAVLTAEQAWKHIGEVRTVRYYVGNPFRSSRGNVFLNEKQDYKTGFTTVIFATIAPVFGDPLQKFGYHTIEVSGLIRMYEGHPEIIVNVPTEIAVIQ